jgi:hypothetical protein
MNRLILAAAALAALGLAEAAEPQPPPVRLKLYVTNSAGDNIHVSDLRSLQVIGTPRRPGAWSWPRSRVEREPG